LEKLKDITGFTPAEKEILDKKYGKPAGNRWEDAKCWDDLVITEERAVISEVREERKGQPQCPYLKTKGEYFCYCDARAKKLAQSGYNLGSEVPTLDSAEYHTKIDHFSLQLSCMTGPEHHQKCMDFVVEKEKS